MTLLLFRPDEAILVVLQTPQSVEEVLEEISQDRWLPPEPYAAAYPPAPHGPRFRAVRQADLLIIMPDGGLPVTLPLPPPGPVLRTVQLTPRQRQVLDHILEGYSNKEIARSLGLTVRTVAFHIHDIKNKLGASSKADIIRRAILLGYHRK